MRRPETSMATTAANLPALCRHDVAGLGRLSKSSPPQQCSTSHQPPTVALLHLHDPDARDALYPLGGYRHDERAARWEWTRR